LLYHTHTYYVYDLSLHDALPILGGILGDKFNAVMLLMIDFTLMIVGAIILGSSNHILLFTIGCLLISVCAGLGNGLIFKLVPFYFSKEAGTANGIVSMMGGLGGFFPPIVISYVTMLSGSSHLAFLLLALFGIIALVTMGQMLKKSKLKL